MCLFEQKPCEVEVGCVTEEGRVWVSRAGGEETVRAALALLTAGPYRRPLPAAPQAPAPGPNTLYIVRTLSGDWYCIYPPTPTKLYRKTASAISENN